MATQTFAAIVPVDGVDTIKNTFDGDNFEFANTAVRERYGESAYAVDCTRYPVSIGDTYVNKVFLSQVDGTPINRENTPEENAALTLQKVSNLESTVGKILNVLETSGLTTSTTQPEA